MLPPPPARTLGPGAAYRSSNPRMSSPGATDVRKTQQKLVQPFMCLHSFRRRNNLIIKRQQPDRDRGEACRPTADHKSKPQPNWFVGVICGQRSKHGAESTAS